MLTPQAFKSHPIWQNTSTGDSSANLLSSYRQQVSVIHSTLPLQTACQFLHTPARRCCKNAALVMSVRPGLVLVPARRFGTRACSRWTNPRLNIITRWLIGYSLLLLRCVFHPVLGWFETERKAFSTNWFPEANSLVSSIDKRFPVWLFSE